MHYNTVNAFLNRLGLVQRELDQLRKDVVSACLRYNEHELGEVEGKIIAALKEVKNVESALMKCQYNRNKQGGL